MKTYKTILAVLVGLVVLSLTFSVAHPQAQTSYIIVHVHNPEGVEIASIQGMNQNSVEIYDGGTLIGYGAYNATTHSQPIIINAGNHNIKVKFNGITMEQNINISKGDTQILRFTFPRSSIQLNLPNFSGSWSMSVDEYAIGMPDQGYFKTVITENSSGIVGARWLIPYNVHVASTLTVEASGSDGEYYTLTKHITSCFPADYNYYSVDTIRSYAFYFDNINIPSGYGNAWFVQGRYASGAAMRVGDIPVGWLIFIDSRWGDWVFHGWYEITDFYCYTLLPGVQSFGLDNIGHDFGLIGYPDVWDANPIAMYLKADYISDIPYDLAGTGIKDEENQAPVASFKSLNVIELGDAEESTFDGGHMVGGVIRFDPTASYDPDGVIIKYEWDFDNGIKFSTNEPNIYDMKFEEARVYNVTLTVTDNDGLTNTFNQTLDLTLKDGDLIFIRTAGYSTLFDLVGNEYTHVGMYIGGQWMIESLAFPTTRSNGLVGIQSTPISGWSYPSETYATLVRVETADDEIRKEAVRIAKLHLGEQYDFKVHKAEVDEPNYYCSELIWAAYYRASGGAINLGNKRVTKKNVAPKGVWPDDIIYDTMNTRIIGYHWEHRPL